MARRSKKGFTLLELLMVVVIIGVLAAIGLPQYFKTVEKMRMAEALSVLASLRASQIRFYSEFGRYTSLAGQLDFDPTVNGAMSGAPYYIYSVDSDNAGVFNAIATRGNTPVVPIGSGCVDGYKLRINQLGVTSGTRCNSNA